MKTNKQTTTAATTTSPCGLRHHFPLHFFSSFLFSVQSVLLFYGHIRTKVEDEHYIGVKLACSNIKTVN
jgi:hypothetical protein